MKKIVMLVVIFLAITVSLHKFGTQAVQAGKGILPASWTAQSSGTRVISLRTYGVDQLVRQSLFGSILRRAIFLALAGFYALIGLYVLRIVLRGSDLIAEPRWKWRDLLWVFASLMVFWEMMPSGESVQTGELFLKDAAVGVWIAALGYVRGVGLREVKVSPFRFFAHVWTGVLSALLLLPTLAVLVLMGSLSGGPTFIPEELRMPVPTSAAAAWLSILILPFFEEILFRVFLYRLLRARWPELASNLATSLIFAAIHGDSGTLAAGRFLGSFLMCRLFERTGTVWSSLGAHAAFNAILLLGPFAL